MAFTISVHLDDTYMYRLLEERLRAVFPDAYICRGNAGRAEQALSEYTVDLVDNSACSGRCTFGTSSCGDQMNECIDIFDISGRLRTVDVKRITEEIVRYRRSMEISSAGPIPSDQLTPVHVGGKLKLLLPFTYADEREEYIREAFDDLKNADSMCIRIDLMSGSRMPTLYRSDLTGGSLTALLENITRIGFRPEDILDYLNPDSTGFLTPGMPDSNDDVYDIGTDASTMLLTKLKQLIALSDGAFNALVVVEGFRFTPLKQLVQYTDELHILLPADKCNTEGSERMIRELKRQLSPGAGLVIHKTDNRPERLIG